MPRAVDQRYMPTDPASQLHYILWSLGLVDQPTRAAMVRIILGVIADQKPCTKDDSTN